MSCYDRLGVRRVINAAGEKTMLGGSLMPPPVLAAMRDAAGAFVDLPELHDRVGERLAVLTRNEAACVTCGAAAGILQAVAACVAGRDQERITALPDVNGCRRREVIIFRGQRNGFLAAARTTGARLVDVDDTEDELVNAITDRTACVLWFADTRLKRFTPPLKRVVAVANEYGVPVVVDAANQTPPISNLWLYTGEAGAALAIFSGGKALRGPQSSGLVVGRRELIAACRANGGPRHSIGRPAKVGKEELVGLLAAVEWSLAQDEHAALAGQEAIVQRWAEGLAGLPGHRVERFPTSRSGQPIPRLVVDFRDTQVREAAINALWDRDPRIAVLPEGDSGVALTPHLLQSNDADAVLAAIRDVAVNGGLDDTRTPARPSRSTAP